MVQAVHLFFKFFLVLPFQWQRDLSERCLQSTFQQFLPAPIALAQPNELYAGSPPFAGSAWPACSKAKTPKDQKGSKQEQQQQAVDSFVNP